MSKSDTPDRRDGHPRGDRRDGPDQRDGRDVPGKSGKRRISPEPLISLDSWWPGDVIGLPAEPPAGTELEVRGGDHNGRRIQRGDGGWSAGDGTWFGVFRTVGPGSVPGVTFVVTKAPTRCAGCDRWFVGPAQQHYHDDNCRRRSSRTRHGQHPKN
jgi:hypothetical protein